MELSTSEGRLPSVSCVCFNVLSIGLIDLGFGLEWLLLFVCMAITSPPLTSVLALDVVGSMWASLQLSATHGDFSSPELLYQNTLQGSSYR